MNEAKQIGAVGSPSTNLELTVDVMDNSSSSKLVGSMLYIESEQDGYPLRITGQVTGISMQNKWHQNDTFRSIIKTDGSLPYLSGHQDIRVADFSVGAVFQQNSEGNWISENLSNVPYSGTAVRKLEQPIVDDLVKQYKDDIFQFGHSYGDKEVRIPMFLKHFGSLKSGGLGEAHHTFVVGKTGSGKSTLSKMLLVGYARHPEMAMLILDPKGEFSDEIAGYQVGESGLPFREMMLGYGRECVRYGITQIQLQTWDLFHEILDSVEFYKDCGCGGGENGLEFIEAIEEILKRGNFNLANLDENALNFIIEEFLYEESIYPERVYKTEEPRKRFLRALEQVSLDQEHRARKTWGFITFLFSKGSEAKRRKPVSSIVKSLIMSETGNRPLVSLDLSVSGNKRDLQDLIESNDVNLSFDTEKDLFTEALQKKVIFRILSEIRREGETLMSERSRQGNKENLNLMCVFEEAHRFAPRYSDPSDTDGKKLTTKLIEGVRETRKYGISWFFIDQTISGIHPEIVQQCRTYWIGYGLSMGNELERLKELVSGDSQDMGLYTSFKDPASYASFSDRQYPWMVSGPVSPMTSNRPMFINAFSGEEFKDYNNVPVSNEKVKIKVDKPNKADIKKKSSKYARGTLKSNIGLDDLGDDDISVFLE